MNFDLGSTHDGNVICGCTGASDHVISDMVVMGTKPGQLKRGGGGDSVTFARRLDALTTDRTVRTTNGWTLYVHATDGALVKRGNFKPHALLHTVTVYGMSGERLGSERMTSDEITALQFA